MTVPTDLALAWLTGRSLARGVPLPVADHGGYRVDTHSEVETCRWIFTQINERLRDLARSVRAPGHLLKWLGEAENLRAVLPNGWHIHSASYFMQADDRQTEAALPSGYRIDVSRTGAVTAVRILHDSGDLAASGYGADTPNAFVYDRIVTAPAHRRKGLGTALMKTLAGTKRHHGPSLLVATDEGRALYTTLRWRTISPYWTAEYIGA
ncbi:MAG TPA: GNAT family N-acetyltransferase [Sphingomonas sanguinis]|uniref:GNAT family N-acetyltransferase n=1 Tax=Sphingomonas sanguinis TaxID=33051 RepID=UPI002ABF4D85|nr:GNAT family N-acetyltransferase [Sphingomonas sanguinis]